MPGKRIVVALGGNALGDTPEEQQKLVKNTAKVIVDLINAGNQVLVAHGNGPQVGMINLAMEIASKSENSIPEMPFPECVAMSQGYIGYHLQNAIREELLKRKIYMPVATIVTQVLVDKNDPAFSNPTKPIGAFYTEVEAKKLVLEKGYQMKEDSGRGWRRVVPSPKPLDVIEKETVQALLEKKQVVIAVGGGGIPVIAEGNSLIGVSAVIDKDYASEKLADLIDAQYLIILTAVEKVCINFGEPDEEKLDYISVEKAERYIKEGHFAPGSMLPKVEVAVKFVKSRQGRKALITSLEKAADGIAGNTGTLIVDEVISTGKNKANFS